MYGFWVPIFVTFASIYIYYILKAAVLLTTNGNKGMFYLLGNSHRPRPGRALRGGSSSLGPLAFAFAFADYTVSANVTRKASGLEKTRVFFFKSSPMVFFWVFWVFCFFLFF
jgi:hypothetical protein